LKRLRMSFRSSMVRVVAFTPKGGCPLKQCTVHSDCRSVSSVAFTPKGGCPLKHHLQYPYSNCLTR